ncbi:hypothetical protein BDA96_01G117200 [Sorghum bicolor]|jgi:hypothetical protein|uniref:Uncharacterized protein n=2 Tax=Sorghum bicolor TaxID=4558 RepID=A0A1Z5S5R7_SORBI|nr:hypothetical protein BDA96_01G117200 [Sorghum bicolor]OQU91095.1 hypothetical protein SORBI_3001G112350 [Sorghum bicolor]
MGNLDLTTSNADLAVRNLDPVVAKTNTTTRNHYSIVVKANSSLGDLDLQWNTNSSPGNDSMLRNLNLATPKISLTPGDIKLVVVEAGLAMAQLPTGARN